MKNKFIAIGIVFPVLTYAQTLSIKQGWQMYAAENTIKNIRIFNKNCIDKVMLYNAHKQDFITHYTKIENYKRTLVEIKEGDAFWIHATSDCTIDLNQKDEIWVKQYDNKNVDDNLKNSVREFYDLYWSKQ